MSNDALCLAAESYMNGRKPRNLHFTKVIYDYKAKTEQQIKDSVQLEIDNVLLKYTFYRFVNSKSHFNKTGGIELQLNFELK